MPARRSPGREKRVVILAYDSYTVNSRPHRDHDPHAADFGVSTNQSTDSTWKISRQAAAEKEVLKIDRVSGGIEYIHEVSDQGQVYQFAKFSGTCDKAAAK
jgi:hypothetical protein